MLSSSTPTWRRACGPLGVRGEEEVREPLALRDVLRVGPHPVAEVQRRAVAAVGVGRVAAQQRRRVVGRHGRLAGRGRRAHAPVTLPRGAG